MSSYILIGGAKSVEILLFLGQDQEQEPILYRIYQMFSVVQMYMYISLEERNSPVRLTALFLIFLLILLKLKSSQHEKVLLYYYY